MADSNLSCPLPLPSGDCILLAHGEGARLSRRLIREEIQHLFSNVYLDALGDGAVLPATTGSVVMATDSFVVNPLFFPGGDIGKLAVHGTINDLAVCGAEPRYLSLGLILEEGLSWEVLRRVLQSIAEAVRTCGILVVTGDTKVVPRGAADQLFVHTTGLGCLRQHIDLGMHRIRLGDRVLVSGTLAEHGIAILSAREGMFADGQLRSDTAPLHELVGQLLNSTDGVHFLRDATRGGVSAVLHEVAEASGATVLLEESALPLNPAVRGACELFGLDPLYVANEGKLVAFVAAETAPAALKALRAHALGKDAAIVGEVTSVDDGEVLVRGPLGSLRVLDEPSGSPLPRIC